MEVSVAEWRSPGQRDLELPRHLDEPEVLFSAANGVLKSLGISTFVFNSANVMAAPLENIIYRNPILPVRTDENYGSGIYAI